MSWTLLAPPVAGDSNPTSFPLTNDKTSHLVLTTGSARLGVVAQLLPQLHTELGRVSIGLWGAKLEAVDDTLSILPAQLANQDVAAVDPRTQKYTLKPRIGEVSEVILLRHGDVVGFSKSRASLICQWTASEIQVNSSAAINGVNETPGEVTEEEEDLDNAIVVGSVSQQMSPQPQPSPQLSNQRSVVVQETPTAARFKRMPDTATAPEPPQNPPSPDISDQGESGVEPFLTARTELFKVIAIPERDSDVATDADAAASTNGFAPIVDDTLDNKSSQRSKSSPRIEIPAGLSRKRSNSATEDESGMESAGGRSNKRTKQTTSSAGDNDTQDSRLSNIIVETSRQEPSRKIAAKGRKRLSEVPEATEASTPKSQRSSQRSNTLTTVDAYDRLAPRVAFSHSAIISNSQAIKFLRKHKGAVVEAINEQNCDVLCVRPGTLTKTMKLLESIALGIPIVTDNWLLDSAKAGQFLALSKYQPNVPKQEEEWKFSLEKVWGKPQAPFNGYTIYFTPELRKSYADFKEIEKVCKTVGGRLTTKKPSQNEKSSQAEQLVVLAKEDKDKELRKLMQDGITCYTKDLLTNSILRGEVDLNSDEFMIDAGTTVAAATEHNTNGTRKKGRKN